MRISEFQTKDVVNVLDGRRLGQITDLEINLKLGQIDAIVVPGQGKFLGLFGGGNDFVIPWRNIVKIGKDVVLVRLEDVLFKEPEMGQADEYRPY
ncbi:YlmC/YmxH family sporulation protein [Ammoniphilus oxalaticus]|uniref:YlmC/YmxH family sporulation protein n=1 Tax=Ammoniphilus oxalaticus TaxID=66863 RepID=A0A419SJA3_9BACL|nr:YlmC/YmxH family sporulation protein [Ammoniphilus oxalaticus]RKD24111.1 YlmC/YmxH family sporulation protein [Ammoniphilus oxalaticus]